MTLNNLIENYVKTRKMAEDEVAGDPRTRPGREMNRRQAQQDLPKVRAELAAALAKVAFPLFLSGAGAARFIGLAGKETDILSVSFEQATGDVRAVARGSISRSREFTPHVLANMTREIRQVGAGLGLDSVPALEYDGAEYLADGAAVDAMVDRYLVKYTGTEFVAALIARAALDQLTERAASGVKFNGPVIPVIVTGLSVPDTVGPKLFSGKFLSAAVGDEVDQKTVLKFFKDIKAALKQ
jgi:hypothetical protein